MAVEQRVIPEYCSEKKALIIYYSALSFQLVSTLKKYTNKSLNREEFAKFLYDNEDINNIIINRESGYIDIWDVSGNYYGTKVDFNEKNPNQSLMTVALANQMKEIRNGYINRSEWVKLIMDDITVNHAVKNKDTEIYTVWNIYGDSFQGEVSLDEEYKKNIEVLEFPGIMNIKFANWIKDLRDGYIYASEYIRLCNEDKDIDHIQYNKNKEIPKIFEIWDCNGNYFGGKVIPDKQKSLKR